MRRPVALGLLLTLSACTKPIPVKLWEHEPECLIDATVRAVRFWNAQLEGQAFALKITDSRICPKGHICPMMQPGKVPAGAVGHTSSHMRHRELYIRQCHLAVDKTVAHEIGHAIRLRHVRGRRDGPGNLMHPDDSGWALTKKQVDRAKRTWFFWFGRISG